MVAPNPLFLRDADLDRGLDLLLIVEREMAARTAVALGRHGLSPADFRSLYLVGRRPGVTLAELARLSGISKQALSRHLQRLLETGRLSREAMPGDRRKQRLRLTEAAALLTAAGAQVGSGGVTKRTTLVVAGAEPGEKLVKAHELGIEIIDEAELARRLSRP